MEPEVRERFERIEATLALTADNHRRAMEELDKRMRAAEKRNEEALKRMEAAEKRADRLDARERSHHKAAMERMDRFDKKLESTRKLVVAGIGMVTRLAEENRRARADTAAFKAEVRAFIRAQGNGRGGSNGKH